MSPNLTMLLENLSKWEIQLRDDLEHALTYPLKPGKSAWIHTSTMLDICHSHNNSKHWKVQFLIDHDHYANIHLTFKDICEFPKIVFKTETSTTDGITKLLIVEGMPMKSSFDKCLIDPILGMCCMQNTCWKNRPTILLARELEYSKGLVKVFRGKGTTLFDGVYLQNKLMELDATKEELKLAKEKIGKLENSMSNMQRLLQKLPGTVFEDFTIEDVDYIDAPESFL